MFTGFASENTPAIQVCDYSIPTAGVFVASTVSLTDDCAPIQYFKTGGTSGSLFSIYLYLPTSPIEGKQIKIINSRFGTNTNQSIIVYSSDTSGFGTGRIIYIIGVGQTLDLCYSKNFISFGSSIGTYASGWIALNVSASSAASAGGVAFGDNNSASAGSSFVGGGYQNTATAFYSSVVGGSSDNATGQYTFIGGGQSNNASGTKSAIIGGQSNTANSTAATILGGYYGNTRSINGYTVLPASVAPIANSTGVSQSALLVLGVQTTDATATVLKSDTSAASGTNQVILPNNSAYYVKGSIIANVTGGGNTKSWDFIATIKRGAGVGTTAIVGAVTLNVQAADSGASTWIVAITADTANGGLAVTVTGQAATTIRWVAKLESTEVSY
jgi:hypothetical protein